MIKIAVIGTGGMGACHIEQFSKIPDCQVVAVCDVNAERARELAAKHKIPKVFGDVEALCKGCDFDAVSNVTPDKFHAPVSLQVLKDGKHLLCEKPLAVCHADAVKMTRAASRAGVINMVNFSYRNSSAIHKAREIVEAGMLGRLVYVEAAYLQGWLTNSYWGDWRTNPGWLWRLSTSHGSKGVLGDIGVHLLDFASYPAGPIESVNCLLHTFPKAMGDKVGEYTLDANDTAIITAKFRNGAAGSLRATRWATGAKNSITLSLYGDEGVLKIDLDRSYKQLELCRVKKGIAEPCCTIECGETPTIYERFITSIKTGVNDQPDFARGAMIQEALDACETSHREGATVKLRD